MSHKHQYESTDLDYDYGRMEFRTFERFENGHRRRPTMGRRRGKAPQSFNGIHRRRRRKIMW